MNNLTKMVTLAGVMLMAAFAITYKPEPADAAAVTARAGMTAVTVLCRTRGGHAVEKAKVRIRRYGKAITPWRKCLSQGHVFNLERGPGYRIEGKAVGYKQRKGRLFRVKKYKRMRVPIYLKK